MPCQQDATYARGPWFRIALLREGNDDPRTQGGLPTVKVVGYFQGNSAESA